MLAVHEIAHHVLERLAAIDVERPHVDEEQAAHRFQDYVKALGLPAPAVRWVPHIRVLRQGRVYPATDKAQWSSFTQRQWWLFNHSPELRTWEGQRQWATAREALPFPEIERLIRIDRTVLDAGLGRSRHVEAVQRVTARLDLRHPLAARDAAPRTPRMEALIPLADAAAAGLFAYAIGGGDPGDIVAVSRPWVRLDDQRQLHDWDGRLAAKWRNGDGLYFWHGVHMTDGTGRNPDRVTASRILGWANAERRRVAIERMGYERFLSAAGATVIQQDDYGKLWRSERLIDREPFLAVEVVNATVEPDGTRRRYFLRVPPDTRSAREAVAWTFGFERKRQYEIAIES